MVVSRVSAGRGRVPDFVNMGHHAVVVNGNRQHTQIYVREGKRWTNGVVGRGGEDSENTQTRARLEKCG